MSATGRIEEAGFTLLEVLVVLAILGLIGGLAFPAVDRALAHQRFRMAAMQVDADLRETRARAIATGSPQPFVAPETDAAMAIILPGAGLIFHADGSASGAGPVLEGAGRRASFAIDQATGAIAGAR